MILMNPTPVTAERLIAMQEMSCVHSPGAFHIENTCSSAM